MIGRLHLPTLTLALGFVLTGSAAAHGQEPAAKRLRSKNGYLDVQTPNQIVSGGKRFTWRYTLGVPGALVRDKEREKDKAKDGDGIPGGVYTDWLCFKVAKPITEPVPLEIHRIDKDGTEKVYKHLVEQ